LKTFGRNFIDYFHIKKCFISQSRNKVVKIIFLRIIVSKLLGWDENVQPRLQEEVNFSDILAQVKKGEWFI